jgi:hypothetical protein
MLPLLCPKECYRWHRAIQVFLDIVRVLLMLYAVLLNLSLEEVLIEVSVLASVKGEAGAIVPVFEALNSRKPIDHKVSELRIDCVLDLLSFA